MVLTQNACEHKKEKRRLIANRPSNNSALEDQGAA